MNSSFLDYLVILVKWKRFILSTLLITMLITYLSIYFFIDELYDSTATIIPTEDSSMDGLASILGDFKGLPLGLGGNTNPEMNMYNTIIYSRTNLDTLINKFNLYEKFEIDKKVVDYKELTRKKLSSSITTAETENMAFNISVRTNNPILSADITNYIIRNLNETILRLKVQKAADNRQFLEKRVESVKLDLSTSEDSLRYFQEESGMLAAEDQIKIMLSIYSDFEAELIKKQIELSVLEKLYDKNAPQLVNIKLQVEELEAKLKTLKSEGQPESVIISMLSLPEKAINYIRLLRKVEINTRILQFILPLYEQAKFDEQKEIPILRVIDNAIPADKKSFPPRTLLTLAITFGVFLLIFIFILMNESNRLNNNEQWRYIRKNLFKWKSDPNYNIDINNKLEK